MAVPTPPPPPPQFAKESRHDLSSELDSFYSDLAMMEPTANEAENAQPPLPPAPLKEPSPPPPPPQTTTSNPPLPPEQAPPLPADGGVSTLASTKKKKKVLH